MNNTLRFAVAAILCTAAVWWYLRKSREYYAPTPMPPDVIVDGGVAAPPDASAPAVAPRFRRIDPAARRALLARMDALRAAREADAGPPPPLPGAPAPLPGSFSSRQVVDAFEPLFDAFEECIDENRDRTHAGDVHLSFKVHVIGDADVGTLIESADVDGDETFRADPELQTCVRETLMAIELPPMTDGTQAFFKTGMTFTAAEIDAGVTP